MGKQHLIDEMNKNIKRNPIPKRSEQEIKDLAKKMLEQMTLEEKLGQLYETSYDGADVTGPEFDSSNVVNLVRSGRVGSILGMNDNVDMYMLQKACVEESRLGIPMFFANDIIHGCRTGYPINLALAGTFDMELVEEAYKNIAFESSHSGVNLTFAPMLDLVRDPRWGRVMESYGEDPYLGVRIAEASVRGFQQDDLTSYDSVPACAKHFVAYGAAEAGRDYNTVDISERMLRQYYLPQFKKAIDCGVTSVMTAFNIYDGVPATQNKFLLRDILREEFGFDGFVISDYTASDETMCHKTSRNKRQVAKNCIKAGLDHEMISTTYIDEIPSLIEDGEVDTKLVDEAVLRILEFKYKIGLFDNPYKNMYANADEYQLLPEMLEHSRDVARKSIVLLKNENNILPLTKQKISVIGPIGHLNQVVGPWGGRVRFEDCIPFIDGLRNSRPDYDITFAQGCKTYQDADENLFNQAVETAKDSDIIVLAMGEHQWMSGESRSRTDITVPKVQMDLARELKKLGKKMVLVLFTGRPLDLTWFEENVDAIVNGWYLGNETGNALADVLFGDYNPSAKLTMSFPMNVGQIPVYYNHFNTGRPIPADNPHSDYVSRYLDCRNEPLYPFGYGLSYTNFEISDLAVSTTKLKENEQLTVTCKVKNTGGVAGEEVVQLYIEALCFSVTRPMNELKGFQKISLEPKEEKQVTFTLTTEDLAYYNIDMEFTAEKAEYAIRVGNASNNLIEKVIETV